MADSSVEDEVNAPLVFMCAQCGKIVGDSFSWVCGNEDLNSITLEGASDCVENEETLETSNRDSDLGSTFTELRCAPPCEATLGRVYKTTARKHDAIRDLITFDGNAITSYQLGSGVNPNSEDSKVALDDLMNMKHVMNADIVKLQNMVMVLDERLEALEEVSPASQRLLDHDRVDNDDDGDDDDAGNEVHSRHPRNTSTTKLPNGTKQRSSANQNQNSSISSSSHHSNSRKSSRTSSTANPSTTKSKKRPRAH